MARVEYESVREEDGELCKLYLDQFMPKHRTGYLRFGPQKVLMPNYYLEFKEAIDNFEVRPDDVWVTSYPKTGTTWTQEMVWCIANDLDFVGAKKILPDRFAFLELTSLFDFRSFPPKQPGEIRIGYGDIDSVTFSRQLPSPRFIKSHLPWQMLPKQIQDGSKKTKVVYVARNVKDTCLSLYHHSVSLGTYAGDFETFAKLFLADLMIYSPFWPHISKFWEHRHDENLLFLKFEDMKKDLPSVIRQTAAFLGKTLTESQVHILAEHLSFSKMKDNPAVNYSAHRTSNQTPFMRKGETGQWKTDMSAELVEQFDEWSKEHLEATGITF